MKLRFLVIFVLLVCIILSDYSEAKKKETRKKRSNSDLSSDGELQKAKHNEKPVKELNKKPEKLKKKSKTIDENENESNIEESVCQENEKKIKDGGESNENIVEQTEIKCKHKSGKKLKNKGKKKEESSLDETSEEFAEKKSSKKNKHKYKKLKKEKKHNSDVANKKNKKIENEKNKEATDEDNTLMEKDDTKKPMNNNNREVCEVENDEESCEL